MFGVHNLKRAGLEAAVAMLVPLAEHLEKQL